MRKIKSPVDGMLLSLKVKSGDSVVKGQTVAVVLILKMENPVPSSCSGVVREIPVKLKGRIKRGQTLMLIDPAEHGTELDCGQAASPGKAPDPPPAG